MAFRWFIETSFQHAAGYDLQVGDGENTGISPITVGKTLCRNSGYVFCMLEQLCTFAAGTIV